MTDTPIDAYTDLIETETDLEATVGAPFPPAAAKELPCLDAICRDYIARSPFAVLATADEDGMPEISPRGDPAGFVAILDDRHLALPERPGNRRADTLRRLIRNPHAALLFLIPGWGETLRVYGTAKLVRDDALTRQFEINGRAPKLVIVIEIARVMIHCPKCVIRSHLWEPGAWPSTEGLQDIRTVMKVHAQLDGTMEELDAKAMKAGVIDLY
ncbi:MSMEG_1061 family FMN-dependent PPOX-type flavoprotein [Chachezhania antarctica]|uniref:MSMEG_1061 family FMN-dependent PPOX-type flavoprotein n=1 Tax=Chachezhania antarctica TaxID=2340860 RepID=UPI0013CE5721|nr:MSMEG_1061 family FMN-dependent PPOX-type flavoprotein [Chachezhania antarctica]